MHDKFERIVYNREKLKQIEKLSRWNEQSAFLTGEISNCAEIFFLTKSKKF
jgi:hypothetical protein